MTTDKPAKTLRSVSVSAAALNQWREQTGDPTKRAKEMQSLLFGAVAAPIGGERYAVERQWLRFVLAKRRNPKGKLVGTLIVTSVTPAVPNA